MSMISSPSSTLKSPTSPEPSYKEKSLERNQSNEDLKKQAQNKRPIGGVAVLPPIGSKRPEESKEKESKTKSQLVYDYEPGRRSNLDQVRFD